MSDNDSFKAMRKLAMTLGVSCPESNEEILTARFINSLNHSAESIISSMSSTPIKGNNSLSPTAIEFNEARINAVFITNSTAMYFEALCNIRTEKLVDCFLHNSQSEMYESIAEHHGVKPMELEGFNIIVRLQRDSYYQYEWCNHQGVWIDCNIIKGETIEKWISEFELS